MNILVVDDDPVASEAAATLLTLHGHAVTQAIGGEEALDLLAANDDFDLLLLDLNMPRVNGLEVLVEARKRGTLHCPVIVLTGLAEEWTEGLTSVAATLTKPVEPALLLETIRRVMDGR